MILEGKIVSQAIKDEIRLQTSCLLQQHKVVPHLAAILIGNNGASETYVANKIKSCEEAGIKSTLLRFDDNCSQETLESAIKQLNDDDSVDGILVQLPLPRHINEEKIINAIDPSK